VKVLRVKKLGLAGGSMPESFCCSESYSNGILDLCKIPVECCNLWNSVFPAGCNDQCIVRKKCMNPGDLFDLFQVHGIGHHDNTGEYLVQAADEFIRETVSLTTDVFFETGCSGDSEFIFRDQPEPDKECFFIDSHARGAGTVK
jgi:hypothetical protein